MRWKKQKIYEAGVAVVEASGEAEFDVEGIGIILIWNDFTECVVTDSFYDCSGGEIHDQPWGAEVVRDYAVFCSVDVLLANITVFINYHHSLSLASAKRNIFIRIKHVQSFQ